MKNKLMLSIMLMLSINSYAQNSCREAYKEMIDHNETVTKKILNFTSTDTDAFQYMLYIGATITAGSAGTGILIAYGAIPLAMLVEHLVEDSINDNRLEIMMDLITESMIISGNEEELTARDVFQNEIVVDGATKKERRAQKRQNRQIRRHNREIEKYNKELVKNKARRQKRFAKLMDKLSETDKFVTNEQVAQIIVGADQKGILCDSTIQTMGMTLDLRNDYVTVQGTKKEQRKLRRHNKEVEKHNEKIYKKLAKKKLAKQKKLIEYIKSEL